MFRRVLGLIIDYADKIKPRKNGHLWTVGVCSLDLDLEIS